MAFGPAGEIISGPDTSCSLAPQRMGRDNREMICRLCHINLYGSEYHVSPFMALHIKFHAWVDAALAGAAERIQGCWKSVRGKAG